ncbi:MAG: hypothetical protein Q4A31_04710, partial [Corynebacterium sp.]|nr:hypothetical protein [Corynebacterium sp.]
GTAKFLPATNTLRLTNATINYTTHTNDTSPTNDTTDTAKRSGIYSTIKDFTIHIDGANSITIHPHFAHSVGIEHDGGTHSSLTFTGTGSLDVHIENTDFSHPSQTYGCITSSGHLKLAGPFIRAIQNKTAVASSALSATTGITVEKGQVHAENRHGLWGATGVSAGTGFLHITGGDLTAIGGNLTQPHSRDGLTYMGVQVRPSQFLLTAGTVTAVGTDRAFGTSITPDSSYQVVVNQHPRAEGAQDWDARSLLGDKGSRYRFVRISLPTAATLSPAPPALPSPRPHATTPAPSRTLPSAPAPRHPAASPTPHAPPVAAGNMLTDVLHNLLAPYVRIPFVQLVLKFFKNVEARISS